MEFATGGIIREARRLIILENDFCLNRHQLRRLQMTEEENQEEVKDTVAKEVGDGEGPAKAAPAQSGEGDADSAAVGDGPSGGADTGGGGGDADSAATGSGPSGGADTGGGGGAGGGDATGAGPSGGAE